MGSKHVYTGTEGDDTIAGTNPGKDTIYGLEGDDFLDGQAQNDILVGGLGQDTLYGGRGKDTFLFQAIEDSTVAQPDLIGDLNENLDHIDLSQIDADTTIDGDQAFHIVSSFSGQAGELVLFHVKALHATMVEGDVDGDGQADFAIEIHGHREDFTGFNL